ncbi:hypothetical protein RJ640_011991 [Escallonia rubra]|uniref:Tify domain-containing protein n=1 Tax=Escallonia rubra TaxID=112253 RepID=A0AA88UHL3_9ASTE|nr:hypothetical protein RJ640_011991 [Escallonia rubra]
MAERSKNWKGYDIDLSCSNSEDADDDPDYIVRFSSRLSKENNSASFNEPIKEGTLRRDGILCFCCYEVYTAENFQVHAGGKPHKSYEYIFVVDKRVSLVSCMIEAWNRPEESERCRVNEIETKGSAGDPYDDACMICADGGNLMQFLKVPGTAPIAFASSACVPAGERTIYLHVLSVRRIVKEKLGKIVGEENQLDDGYSWTLLQRTIRQSQAMDVNDIRLENQSITSTDSDEGNLTGYGEVNARVAALTKENQELKQQLEQLLQQ